jgi:hypothetical protein
MEVNSKDRKFKNYKNLLETKKFHGNCEIFSSAINSLWNYSPHTILTIARDLPEMFCHVPVLGAETGQINSVLGLNKTPTQGHVTLRVHKHERTAQFNIKLKVAQRRLRIAAQVSGSDTVRYNSFLTVTRIDCSETWSYRGDENEYCSLLGCDAV